MAKAYENVVFDMACDACKHLTDAAAYRSTKGKKNARELAMCCGHLFKGTKQKIAAETFIKTTKVDCYVDGEWVSSSIRYFPGNVIQPIPNMDVPETPRRARLIFIGPQDFAAKPLRPHDLIIQPQ